MKVYFDKLTNNNLDAYAKAFNVGVERLSFSKCLAIDFVEIQQEKQSFFYTLKSGETSISLSNKFGMPESFLKRYNKNLIFDYGVTIYVPVCNYKSYVAKPTDTISSIAKKIGVSIEKIKDINGVDFVFASQVIYYEKAEI